MVPPGRKSPASRMRLPWGMRIMLRCLLDIIPGPKADPVDRRLLLLCLKVRFVPFG